MAYCANCGHQISDYAQSCPSCGHPRVATPIPAETAGVPHGRWPGAELGLPQYGPNSLADPGQRLVARIIDSVIVGIAFFILFFVVAIALGGADTAGAGDDALGGAVVIMFILAFAAFVAYEVGLTATRGQTVGKMAMGIKVVDEATGQAPGWGPSFIRWVIPLLIGIVPFGTIVDALWLLWDKNRQCLHDKPAKTLVIRIR